MITYSQFLFEKIITDPQTLLDTIKAKLISSGEVFDIDSDKFTDLESIYNDNNFNKKLISKDFKKDKLEVAKKYETFLKNSLNVKYFLVFKDNQNELERPKYMFVQIKQDGKWGKIELYKVNADMKNFYDLLSNKTIEIKLNGKNYVYKTTNGGNDWTIQNTQNQDNTFQKILRGEDINKILTTQGISVAEI